jgi:hypothetical protein
VPEPLDLPPGHGASLLLARQRALAACLAAADDAHLDLAVDLRGEFPEGASHNFRVLVTSLAASDVGAALGLAEGLPTLRIQAGAEGVALTLRVGAPSVARGLLLLMGSEVGALNHGLPQHSIKLP